MLKLLKQKKPSISSLATIARLTAVENKIPDISNLVKKTDYHRKILQIESKYFATAYYNKFTKQTLDAKIKENNQLLLDS